MYRCPSCGLDSSVHGFAAHPAAEADHFRGVDRAAYDRSVRATREASYPQLLARVRGLTPRGRWLDVGCSFGWLLERVESSGYRGFGLDPSLGAVAEARAAGLRVCAGIFPEALSREARFEVVSLMDVLEHLADPVAAIRNAARLIAADGVLVVQVPDRDCLLYGCAVALARLAGQNLGFALRRLWLSGFDFPHLWYFTAPSLSSLLELGGMEVLDLRRIPIGSPRQAIDRVRYAGSGKALVDAALAGGVALLNGLDAAWGHGGLIEVLARPSRPRVMRT
ncbi:MAG TPA: class I SAM-dependent methyltransferase [Thermoanaerobaculia bacterium]|nr:class I SAM-dependent methyltransferase [Thermoanaerobaculia bacterium]